MGTGVAVLELGRPGGFASHLARRAVLHAAVGYGLATVALWLWFSWGFPLSAAGWVLIGSAFAAAVAADVQRGRFRRASVGARTERDVAAVLRRSGWSLLAHGALLGAGGDADHVLVGPGCVLVESKTGRGRLELRDGSMVVGGRRLPGDPLAQARRQAAALRQLLGVGWVDAVVCVPGLEGGPRTQAGVTVCSTRDLPAVLAAAGRVDPGAPARARAVLEPRVGVPVRSAR